MRGPWRIPAPSSVLCIFWSADKRKEKHARCYSSTFKVVVGVSKVCQVSQLYPAIDDLATRELGSMMPSLFTLQASLVFFSRACATVLCFLCSASLVRLVADRWRQINCIYLSILCRLTANTFFDVGQISKRCSWTCGHRLKKYKAPGLLTDLILYYRVRQTWHSKS